MQFISGKLKTLGMKCVTLLLLAMSTYSLSFHAKGTEYQKCLFNMVYDQQDSMANDAFKRDSLDGSTSDLIEEILVSNQDSQIWTLSTLALPGSRSSLSSSNYLYEICSVNIVVAVKRRSCFYRDFREIFSTRMHDARNMFLLIIEFHSQSECSTYVTAVQTGHAVDVYFILYLSRNHRSGEQMQAFCTSCSYAHKYVHMKPEANLLEMKLVSQAMKTASVQPIIAVMSLASGHIAQIDKIRACAFLYKASYSTEHAKFIGCEYCHVFIENVASHLNFSVEYIHRNDALKAQFFLHEQPKHYAVVALLELVDWVNILIDQYPPLYITQILKDNSISYFVYCSESEERESFSILFWTTPLDSWTWIFIGISCLTVTALLKGNWFAVFSILMRQGSSVLVCKKWLITLSLAGIIFTYGYEGIISSFITVPPPFKVFNTLKQLLENGYKIHIDYGAKSSRLLGLFKRENITKNLESSLVYSRMSQSNKQLSLGFCNLTVPVDFQLVSNTEIKIRRFFPRVRCHHARGSYYKEVDLYSVFGNYQLSVIQLTRQFLESGILNMFTDNYYYTSDLSNKRSRELSALADREPEVFHLKDWKILSIIVIWVILLGVASLEFLFEVICRKRI